MVEARNDGGPAFPFLMRRDVGYAESRTGMTLRDYFAARVMQGFITAKLFVGKDTADRRAEQAYMIADAMLEARGGTTE